MGLDMTLSNVGRIDQSETRDQVTKSANVLRFIITRAVIQFDIVQLRVNLREIII